MNVKKRSQKQEKQVAKDLNAKTVVASGALWGAKGDVRSDKFLVECKTTSKSFYSLTATVWGKIKKEAVKDGLRIPVMCIQVQGKSFAILEKSVVQEYFEQNNLIYFTERVTAKSFRVKDSSYINLEPIYYYCENTAWGKQPERLIQMCWEDFLCIADKI